MNPNIDPKVGLPLIGGNIVTVAIGLVAIFAPEVADEIRANPEFAVALVALVTTLVNAGVGYWTRNAASPPPFELRGEVEPLEPTTLERERKDVWPAAPRPATPAPRSRRRK